MSLRVWLPLDGNLDNNGIDNYTITTKNLTVNASGKIGSCYNFDSEDISNIVLTPALFSNDTTTMSYCCWVKFATLSGTQALFCNRIATDSLGFAVFTTSPTALLFDTGQRYTCNLDADHALIANQWYHLCFTYDRNNKKTIYINGTKVGESSPGTAPTGANASAMYIGTSQNGTGGPFNGWLNDVRIYDHCLSAEEVKNISEGLVIHYKLDNHGLGGKNLLQKTLDSKATPVKDVININNTYFTVGGQGSTYAYATRTAAPHGFRSTVTSAKRPYIALGHPTIATALAAPDPMWGCEAGKTYTFSGQLEYQIYSGNLTLSSYFVIRLYYATSTEATAWTNGGNLTTFRTVPGEIHNYDFAVTFTLPEDTVSWYVLVASNNTAAANNLAGDYVQVSNMKLEEGDTTTPYTPAPEDFNINTAIIEDSSGYHHHATALGDLSISSNTARHTSSTVFNGTNAAIKGSRATQVDQAKEITFCCWAYMPDWSPGTDRYFMSSQESGGFIIQQRATSGNMRARVSAYTAEDLSTFAYINADWGYSSTILTAGWHFFAGVYTTSFIKLYIDGVVRKTTTTATYGLHFNTSTNLYLGAECAAANPSNYCNCQLSDARIYCTALLDTDIKKLYNIGMGIDNMARMHSYDFNELIMQPQLSKQCVVSGQVNEMIYCPFDPQIYTEPDGSQWIHIFHHNSPANIRFESTDSFTSYASHVDSENPDYNCWFYVSLCNYLPTWEFIIKTTRTTEDTLYQKRWIQSVNPMVALAEEVTADQITKITEGGYNNNSWGGLYKRTVNNSTWLNLHNGTEGNWYGAIGSYLLWNGGSTGFRGTGSSNAVTTGYIDLYVRIDNIPSVNLQNIGVNLHDDIHWLTNQIIER